MFIKDVPEKVDAYVREYFLYEPETGYLWRTKTTSKSVDLNKPVGSRNSQGYLDVDLGKAYGKKVRNTRVHRVAWFLSYGIWPNQQLDHINGNKEDNRLINLRLVDHRKNQRNGFSKVGTSSLYKGVSRKGIKWRAYIVLPDKKMKHLGYFDNEISAAVAYDQAAREYFGEFSRLNFPTDGSVPATESWKSNPSRKVRGKL